MKSQEYTIYTDGSFRPPSYGAWASVTLINKKVISIDSDYTFNTTNNRMELQAIITSIKKLPVGSRVIIYSDSLYCVRSIKVWIKAWVRYNWKNYEGKSIKNVDLMKELYDLMQKYNIRAKHVYGHSGNKYNEICDKICNSLTKDMINGTIRQ